jgi:hypothetical protein
MTLSLLLVCVPFLAAAALAVPQWSGWRHWLDRGGALAGLGLALCLPWNPGAAGDLLPADRLGALVAILVASGACAARVRPHRQRPITLIGGQIMLGGMLLAPIGGEPVLIASGLILTIAAALARDLPARWHRVPLSGAGLGLILFGTLMAPSRVAAGCALLGLGTLAAVVPETLIVMLSVAARLSVLARPETIALGVAALLAGSAVLLLRPGQRGHLVLVGVGQGGVVAMAFGLGSPDSLFAGLVLLVLLAISQISVGMAREGGGDALVAAAGLAGLPPLGVFPGVALVVVATAERGPSLLLPLLAGLGAMGWVVISRLPSFRAARLSLGQISPAWFPVAVALLIGFFLPAPTVDWLRTVASDLR